VAGWRPLLDLLAEHGLIGRDVAGLIALTADEYNRPDAPAGRFVGRLTLEGQTPTINGRPLR
jgi:hypothetical protein